MNLNAIGLNDFIRDIPDFPKPGIVFKDITPLLKSPEAFRSSIMQMIDPFRGEKIDLIVGIESRGFIFGAPMAAELSAGFVPVRKKGKLPFKTKQVEYALEYGTDILEIHEDAIEKGSNVLIVDDVLATGGTVSAVAELTQSQGINIVGFSFLMELSFLNGRQKLDGQKVESVLKY